MSPVSTRYPTGTDDERESAIDAAAAALQQGGVIVLPTDTVYGVAADAFDKGAVQALLAAKGRGREKPPPVLVGNVATLDALATRVPEWARTLVDELWPGGFTIVLHQQPSLQWDLGEARGTVAVRMPDLELTRDVIDRVGPLAVSSANKSGMPPATSADQAEEMLGDTVEVFLDGGDTPGSEPSTIVDATGEEPRLLRLGVVSVARINELLAQHDLKLDTGEVAKDEPEDGSKDESEDEQPAVTLEKSAAQTTAETTEGEDVPTDGSA